MRNWEVRHRGVAAAVLTGTLLLLVMLVSAGKPTQAPAADDGSATGGQPTPDSFAARPGQVPPDDGDGYAAPRPNRKTIDRYKIAGGCYAIRSLAGGYVTAAGGGYNTSSNTVGGATHFRMQATTLSEYLLYTPDEKFLSGDVDSDNLPSRGTEWRVTPSGDAFTLTNKASEQNLSADGGSIGTGGANDLFMFVDGTNCSVYPEPEVNVTGTPGKGLPRYGEVTGTVDAHMHHMAFEFLSGLAHCGQPWHRYGVAYALVDCPDHEGDGRGAILENVTYGSGDPFHSHDTRGWPDFPDWPHHNSLTHEQSYYKWLERSWRSGLRIFTNLLVENRVLCEIYPPYGKKNSCNEFDSVKLQAKRMHQLEDYIDAQEGGPGKGWYRIVDNPYEARKVANQGKLAVIMGMEVSEPFNCRMFKGVSTCDQADVRNRLNTLYDMGVRQMEITNKFDNAFTGVAGDGGSTGTITNSGNFYATGEFWDLETCEDPENTDHTPTAVEVHNDDLVIANGLQELLPGGLTPVYPAAPHCNQRGLTELGKFLINQMIDKGMIFDPDHMSVIARDAAMTLIESHNYSGVMSSHSWSTPNALPRIYKLGGVITPYGGGSEGFVGKWEAAKDAYRGRQYWGLGYGADMNGLGGQGGPRGLDTGNPVTYPFKSFDGSTTVDRQASGNRTFDINTDGVAHYGLFPDWVEDLRMLAGDEIVNDLNRGAEAYLQMWERARGITKLRCPNWKGHIHPKGFGKMIPLGRKPIPVLRKAGQPVHRHRAWKWCGRGKGGANDTDTRRRKMVAVFRGRGSSAKSAFVASTLQKHETEGVHRGSRRADIPAKAKQVTNSLYTLKTAKGSSFVFGVKKGKVTFTGVADRFVAKGPAVLNRYVRRAGLNK